MILQVPNWERHQHYRGRQGWEKPAWIKLYRDILGNYELMHLLDDKDRWLAVGLWLLAAETGNKIPSDCDYLTHRLRTSEPVTEERLALLKSVGVIEDTGCLDEVYTKSSTSRVEEKREDKKRAESVAGARGVENSEVGELVAFVGEEIRWAVDVIARMPSTGAGWAHGILATWARTSMESERIAEADRPKVLGLALSRYATDADVWYGPRFKAFVQRAQTDVVEARLAAQKSEESQDVWEERKKAHVAFEAEERRKLALEAESLPETERTLDVVSLVQRLAQAKAMPNG